MCGVASTPTSRRCCDSPQVPDQNVHDRQRQIWVRQNQKHLEQVTPSRINSVQLDIEFAGQKAFTTLLSLQTGTSLLVNGRAQTAFICDFRCITTTETFGNRTGVPGLRSQLMQATALVTLTAQDGTSALSCQPVVNLGTREHYVGRSPAERVMNRLCCRQYWALTSMLAENSHSLRAFAKFNQRCAKKEIGSHMHPIRSENV